MQRDSVQLTIDLLRTTFGSDFKEYYDGDPDRIPAFNLPALVVDQPTGTSSKASVAEHDVLDTIRVKVVFNKKDDWADNVDPLNLTHYKIRKAIAGRDETTGRYLGKSILGALVSGLDGDRRLGKGISMEYGRVKRPGDVVTAEGHVTFQVLHSVYTN